MTRHFHRNRKSSVHVYNFDDNGDLEHQVLSDEARAAYVRDIRDRIRAGTYDAEPKLEALFEGLFNRLF